MDGTPIFPNHGLPLTGRENLESKCQSVERILVGMERRGFAPIGAHGREVLGAVRNLLADADFADDSEIALTYYTLAWLNLETLNRQIETFFVSVASRDQPAYIPSELILQAFSERAGLSTPPILLLGSSYYSTGSFGYQERERRRLRPFYQVSTDCSDSVLVLPALAHEVFHCILNESGFQELRGVLVERGLKEEEHAERLEEALCDALATRMTGPAFVYAFVGKYWQAPADAGGTHPRDTFRLRVMYDQIQRACDGPIAKRLTAHWPVNREDSNLEPLSIMADEICDFAVKRIRSAFPMEFLGDENTAGTEHRDPVRLMNAAWLGILETRWSFAKAEDWVSALLERWSRPGEPPT